MAEVEHRGHARRAGTGSRRRGVWGGVLRTGGGTDVLSRFQNHCRNKTKQIKCQAVFEILHSFSSYSLGIPALAT